MKPADAQISKAYADMFALFDLEWYEQQSGQKWADKMQALNDFLRSGWKKGFDPHPLFSCAFYSERNPDVKEAGMQPFFHFAYHGHKEGRDPHPMFSVLWYKKQSMDCISTDGNALLHYLQAGAQAGLRPNPDFDPQWYAEFYQAQIERTEPLRHYVTAGLDAGLFPSPEAYLGLTDDPRLKRCAAAIVNPDVQVVSFDVFDTVVCRSYFYPKDLFSTMNRMAKKITGINTFSFSKYRVECEALLRRNLHEQGGHEDPSLSDIYMVMQERFGLTASERDKIMDIEVSKEISCCYPRSTGYALYKLCVYLGKKIIFTSDMYLPAKVVRAMLSHCGYSSDYPLFVSSEEGATKKGSGDLYRIASHKIRANPSNILHFGDHRVSDVRNAEKAGWKALLLAAPRSAFLEQESKAFWPTSHNGILANCLNSGLVVRHLSHERRYDAEFEKVKGEPWSFGYCALGPLLLSAVLWMRDEASRTGLKKLYFLARDGYLPLRAWQAIERSLPMPCAAEYLPISRKMIFPYLAAQRGGLHEVCRLPSDASQTVWDYLSHRLGSVVAPVIADDLLPFGVYAERALIKDVRDFVDEAIRRREKYIVGEASEVAARIRSYYKAKFPRGGRAGVFDVGRKGTFQKVLSQIAGQDMHGMYLVVSQEVSDNVEQGRFSYFLPMIDGARKRNPDTILYEALFSERDGSFVGLDEDLRPVRELRQDVPLGDEAVRAVQGGALQYVLDATDLFGENVAQLRMEGSTAATALDAMVFSDSAAGALPKIHHDDTVSFSGTFSLADLLDKRARADPRFTFAVKGDWKRLIIYCPAMTRIRGGVERVVAKICPQLVQAGIDVLVVCNGSDSGRERPVYELPPGVQVRNVDTRDPSSMSAYIDVYQPDAAVILGSGYSVATIAAPFAKRGIPFMLGERSAPSTSLDGYWRGYSREDYCQVYRTADVISVQFPAYAEDFPEWLRHKVRVIPNPVDLVGKDDLEGTQRKNVILYAGRLHREHKRPHLLIRAFAMIAEFHPDWVLHMYGHDVGGERQTLMEMVTTMNLQSRVTVFDPVDNIEMAYRSSKIFVIPSLLEGFPNALSEALANGLPAIGFSECPGVSDLIVHDENGILADCHVGADEASLAGVLAESIQELIQDDERRRRLSAGAISSVAQYDTQIVSQQWLEEVDALFSSKREPNEADFQYLMSYAGR